MSSILKVDQLQDSGGNNLVTSNGSGVITAAGFGKVAQVVQDVEQGQITYSSSYADALSLSITPSSTSSKILLTWHCSVGRGQDDYGAVSLFKDGTIVSGAIANTATSNRVNASNAISNRGNLTGDIYFVNQTSNCFLDSPASSSAITYAIKIKCSYGSNVYLNRSENDADLSHNHKTMSSLTAMEILP
mgnify:CR=1 FL=1